jgi:membrane associated rhomboid family serine protease
MVRERVGDWRSAWRFALAGLLAGLLVVATSQTSVAAPLFYALQDQLFRVLRVTAIREGRDAQWVQIPTDAALKSYETYKQRYAQQSVFAAAPQTEA